MVGDSKTLQTVIPVAWSSTWSQGWESIQKGPNLRHKFGLEWPTAAGQCQNMAYLEFCPQQLAYTPGTHKRGAHLCPLLTQDQLNQLVSFIPSLGNQVGKPNLLLKQEYGDRLISPGFWIRICIILTDLDPYNFL